MTQPELLSLKEFRTLLRKARGYSVGIDVYRNQQLVLSHDSTRTALARATVDNPRGGVQVSVDHDRKQIRVWTRT